MYIHFHRVIPDICCLRYNNGRQLTNISLLFFPLQVDCESGKDMPLPCLPRLEMIYLGKSEVLFPSRLSWVILLSLYSQVHCGLMLFIVILIWEGEFLNFDCSVFPSRRRKSRTSTGSCTKSPPLPGVPSPPGMADDRCIKLPINFHKSMHLDSKLTSFLWCRHSR